MWWHNKLIFPSQPTNLKLLKVIDWKQHLLIAQQPQTLAISNMLRSPIHESCGFNPSKTNLPQENVVSTTIFLFSPFAKETNQNPVSDPGAFKISGPISAVDFLTQPRFPGIVLRIV